MSSAIFFGIHVVDEETGRGVPLVELETVHHLRYVTDSAGWIALDEPDLMDQPVFFHVKSHGYEHAKDGFGFAGLVLTPEPGTGGGQFAFTERTLRSGCTGSRAKESTVTACCSASLYRCAIRRAPAR